MFGTVDGFSRKLLYLYVGSRADGGAHVALLQRAVSLWDSPGDSGRWRGHCADLALTYRPFLVTLMRTWRGQRL